MHFLLILSMGDGERGSIRGSSQGTCLSENQEALVFHQTTNKTRRVAQAPSYHHHLDRRLTTRFPTMEPVKPSTLKFLL